MTYFISVASSDHQSSYSERGDNNLCGSRDVHAGHLVWSELQNCKECAQLVIRYGRYCTVNYGNRHLYPEMSGARLPDAPKLLLD